MFLNFTKIFFRKFGTQKLYSLINLSGLIIGMSCSLLIFLYVFHELSYDKYHSKSEKIYRVTQRASYPNGYNHHFARCPDNYINNLPTAFPEIETLIRFQHDLVTNMRVGTEKFIDKKTFKTDVNVFEVFDFELISGDSKTALQKPNSIVMTEKMAKKYFGQENPMGKEITLSGSRENRFEVYNITGIMRNLPTASHFQINCLISFRSPEDRTGWAYAYLLLKQNTDPNILEQKFPEFIEKYAGEGNSDNLFLHLTKLTDIHLHSHLAREIEPNGDILHVYIFSIVGIFILLVACINYMNLSTARSLERAKEVGVRKVLGAPSKQLIGYFLTESLLFTTIAFSISLFLVWFIFPTFNSLVGKFIQPNIGKTIAGFLGMAFLTGLLSGSYPAFILASFQPISTIKGKIGTNHLSGFFRKLTIRKSLVIVQLIISIGLIACTLITFQQFNFLSNKKLSLNKDQIIAIQNIPNDVKSKYYLFKNELKQITEIVDVSASMEVPSREIRDTGPIYAEGKKEGQNTIVIDIQAIDQNFIDFMEIDLVAGINFSPTVLNNSQFPQTDLVEHVNEKPRTYLLNETAVKAIGWDSPTEALGKQFSWGNALFNFQRGSIIGVIKDYHQESLRNKIDPVVFVYEPVFLGTILIKINPIKIDQSLSKINQKWNEIYPQYPLEHVFLDELFEHLYFSEKKQTQILSIFTGVAIFIAFMGIFGLAAYIAENRMKEIGIRKVLGASVSNILILFVREYLIFAVIAGVIVTPIVWYFLEGWLENFAYRIDIHIFIFLLATGVTLLISILTVCFQSIKAALINPAQILRYE